MSDEVIKVGFQVDQGALVGDAESAGKAAAAAFEKGFGQIKLKIPEPTVSDFQKQAQAIGKMLQPVVMPQPAPAAAEAATGGESIPEAAPSAERTHHPVMQNGGKGGDGGEGGKGGDGGHGGHAGPGSFNAVAFAIKSMGALGAAVQGVNEVLEAGTFAAAAKGAGELGEHVGEAAEKYHVIGKEAGESGAKLEKLMTVGGLATTAVGGAIGAVQMAKGFADDARGTVESVGAEARMAGVPTAGMVNISEAFAHQGVQRSTIAPILGGLNLKTQRERAAVERRVSLEPLDEADALEGVAEAYRKRQDAAEATADAEEKIITTRAAKAVTLSGAAVRDQIAKEAGPMNVVESLLGFSEAQEGQRAQRANAPFAQEDAQRQLRVAQATAPGQEELQFQEAKEGIEGAKLNVGSAELQSWQAQMALRQSRGQSIPDAEMRRFQKASVAHRANLAAEGVREAELRLKRAELGQEGLEAAGPQAEEQIAKAQENVTATENRERISGQRSDLNVQRSALNATGAVQTENDRKRWFDLTGSNVPGELSPAMQIARAGRAVDASLRGEDRALAGYAAASRGITRAEAGAEALPLGEISRVALALQKKEGGEKVNLRKVDPLTLALAMTHIVDTQDKYGGEEGTGQLGALKDIRQTLGNTPELEGMYRSMLIASSQGRLDKRGADDLFQALVGNERHAGISDQQLRSIHETEFESEEQKKIHGPEAREELRGEKIAKALKDNAAEDAYAAIGVAVADAVTKALGGEAQLIKSTGKGLETALPLAAAAGGAAEGFAGKALTKLGEAGSAFTGPAADAIGADEGSVDAGVLLVGAAGGAAAIGLFVRSWVKKQLHGVAKSIGESVREGLKEATTGDSAAAAEVGGEAAAKTSGQEAAAAVAKSAAPSAEAVAPKAAAPAAEVASTAAQTVEPAIADASTAAAKAVAPEVAAAPAAAEAAPNLLSRAAAFAGPILRPIAQAASGPAGILALTDPFDQAAQRMNIPGTQESRYPENYKKYGVIGGTWENLKEDFGYGERPEVPTTASTRGVELPQTAAAQSVEPPPPPQTAASALTSSTPPQAAAATAQPPQPVQAAQAAGGGQELAGAGSALQSAASALQGAASALQGAAGSIQSTGASSGSGGAGAGVTGGGGEPDVAEERASGGMIRGAGSGTSDSIATSLRTGDYIVNASSTAHWGQGFLDSIRHGNFADGGRVPAYVSNGEYHFPKETVQRYGLRLFEHINAQKYASGGHIIPINYTGFEGDPVALAKAKRNAGVTGLNNISTGMVNWRDSYEFDSILFNMANHFQAEGGLIQAFEEGGHVKDHVEAHFNKQANSIEVKKVKGGEGSHPPASIMGALGAATGSIVSGVISGGAKTAKSLFMGDMEDGEKGGNLFSAIGGALGSMSFTTPADHAMIDGSPMPTGVDATSTVQGKHGPHPAPIPHSAAAPEHESAEHEAPGKEGEPPKEEPEGQYPALPIPSKSTTEFSPDRAQPEHPHSMRPPDKRTPLQRQAEAAGIPAGAPGLSASGTGGLEYRVSPGGAKVVVPPQDSAQPSAHAATPRADGDGDGVTIVGRLTDAGNLVRKLSSTSPRTSSDEAKAILAEAGVPEGAPRRQVDPYGGVSYRTSNDRLAAKVVMPPALHTWKGGLEGEKMSPGSVDLSTERSGHGRGSYGEDGAQWISPEESPGVAAYKRKFNIVHPIERRELTNEEAAAGRLYYDRLPSGRTLYPPVVHGTGKSAGSFSDINLRHYYEAGQNPDEPRKGMPHVFSTADQEKNPLRLPPPVPSEDKHARIRALDQPTGFDWDGSRSHPSQRATHGDDSSMWNPTRSVDAAQPRRRRADDDPPSGGLYARGGLVRRFADGGAMDEGDEAPTGGPGYGTDNAGRSPVPAGPDNAGGQGRGIDAPQVVHTESTSPPRAPGPPSFYTGEKDRSGRTMPFADGGGVPARVSNGEYQMPAASVSRAGNAFMDFINTARFSTGGMVGDDDPDRFAYGGGLAPFSTASDVPHGPSQGAGGKGMDAHAEHHTLDLTTSAGTFRMRATSAEIENIRASAIGDKLASHGPAPSWY